MRRFRFSYDIITAKVDTTSAIAEHHVEKNGSGQKILSSDCDACKRNLQERHEVFGMADFSLFLFCLSCFSCRTPIATDSDIICAGEKMSPHQSTDAFCTLIEHDGVLHYNMEKNKAIKQEIVTFAAYGTRDEITIIENTSFGSQRARSLFPKKRGLVTFVYKTSLRK